MTNLFQILKNKKEPQIPIHIILLIVENYSYMCRLHLNYQFSFTYTIFKSQRRILNCRRGYIVISRKLNKKYSREIIIRDEKNKVDITIYNCVIQHNLD